MGGYVLDYFLGGSSDLLYTVLVAWQLLKAKKYKCESDIDPPVRKNGNTSQNIELLLKCVGFSGI